MELGILDRVMGDRIFLLYGDGGPLVVFKMHRPVPVGIEGNKLAGGVWEVRRRDRLLNHLIDRGQEVGEGGGAVRPGGHFRYTMAVRAFHKKHSPLDRSPGVGVPFHHRQIGPLVILQTNRAVFAGKQLHMVLRGVQDVV